MKKTFLILSVLFLACSLQAQDIFKKHGFKKETLTLSKGKYEEVFTNKEIIQIGTVLLNTKTNKVVEFLDEETEDTSFKAEHSSRFLTPDPLAEKYPNISPYAYCANNPIKYVDPDGRDIKIYYQDENDDWQTWVFNGQNQSEAPNNAFISDFITVYNSSERKGVGDNIIEAATNGELSINLIQSPKGINEFDYLTSETGERERAVHWNPKKASGTAEGYTRSPATNLEHEFDHAVSYFTDPKGHEKRTKTYDRQYDNLEERRVITGSEAKTAQGRGEYPKRYTRKDHDSHQGYRVNSPVSNRKLWRKDW